MAILTQVLEVLNNTIKESLKILLPYLWTISFGIVLIASFKIYPLFAFLISFIFWKMIKEDYFEHTIDLRLLSMLGCLLFFNSPHCILFLMKCLIGFFVFQTLFYMTMKIYSKEQRAYTANVNLANQPLAYGYLPVLGTSMFLYLWYLEIFHPPIPKLLMPTYVGLIELQEWLYSDIYVLGIVGLCCASFILAFRYKIKKAQKNGNIIIYGFGDGDPLVLAVFTGLLGHHVFVVFFISLFISIFFYIYHLLKQKKEDVVNA